MFGGPSCGFCSSGRGQQQITVKHVTANNVTADQAIIAGSVTTGGDRTACPDLLAASSGAPMMPILDEAAAGSGGGGVRKRNDRQPHALMQWGSTLPSQIKAYGVALPVFNCEVSAETMRNAMELV